MISQLSAKYQLCAIHTADNSTDGKVTTRESGPFVHRIRERSLIPAQNCAARLYVFLLINRVK